MIMDDVLERADERSRRIEMDLPDTPDLDALVHFAEHGPHVLRQYNMLYEALAARDAEIAQLKLQIGAFEKVGKSAGKMLVDGLQNEAMLKGELAQRDARIAELEKDRDRLDWMQKMNSEVFWINAKLCEVTLGLTVGSGEAEDLRSAIDAAIAAAKGE